MDLLFLLIIQLVVSMPACSKELKIHKPHEESQIMSSFFKIIAILLEIIDPITSHLIQNTFNIVVKKDIKSFRTAG